MLIQIFNFFETYSGAITAISTIILAIITGYYAKLTKGMLDATLSAKQPILELNVDRWTMSSLKVSIVNNGATSANNIIFAVKKTPSTEAYKIEGVKNIDANWLTRISNIEFIKKGVSCLGSSQSVVGEFDETGCVFDGELTIECKYNDDFSKQYIRNLTFDFQVLSSRRYSKKS